MFNIKNISLKKCMAVNTYGKDKIKHLLPAGGYFKLL